MIVLHHLNNSRSQRILWLLEELGLEYRIERYQRQPSLAAPPELKAVHPLGKSPVITDDGNTLAESAAIIEYLVDRRGQGRFKPKAGTPEELRYKYFLHYAEGSLQPQLLVGLLFSMISGPRVPIFVRPFGKLIAAGIYKAYLNPQFKTHFGFLEGELNSRSWFVGDEFTAADIQMSYPLEIAHTRGLLKPYPALTQFVERIQMRPAYQRALKAGGPYSLNY